MPGPSGPASVARTRSASANNHGSRSASVSGVPARIRATLAGGWSSSASWNGQPIARASSRPTTVLPEPLTPMTITTSGRIVGLVARPIAPDGQTCPVPL